MYFLRNKNTLAIVCQIATAKQHEEFVPSDAVVTCQYLDARPSGAIASNSEVLELFPWLQVFISGFQMFLS
jgi:hypothetical protein